SRRSQPRSWYGWRWKYLMKIELTDWESDLLIFSLGAAMGVLSKQAGGPLSADFTDKCCALADKMIAAKLNPGIRGGESRPAGKRRSGPRGTGAKAKASGRAR